MPQAPAIRDHDCYEMMMSEIRTPTTVKARKRALNAGRQRLAHLARRIAKRDTKRMSRAELAEWQTDLQQLRRMCIAQYVLRRRQLQQKGRDLEQWAAEPETPRQPGSVHQLVALANRVGAATPNGNEAQAAAIRALLNAAKTRPKE